MECFAKGFVSHFEYAPPVPWGDVQNYMPLVAAVGRAKLREAMKIQILLGKMIGGPG